MSYFWNYSQFIFIYLHLTIFDNLINFADISSFNFFSLFHLFLFIKKSVKQEKVLNPNQGFRSNMSSQLRDLMIAVCYLVVVVFGYRWRLNTVRSGTFMKDFEKSSKCNEM